MHRNDSPHLPAPAPDVIADLMADLASGRGDRVFDLVHLAQQPLERLVRGTLVRYGRRSLAADPAEVDFLVMTAAMVILDRATGWRPDGSPPWVWARHAIRSAIAAYIGHARAGDDPGDLIDHATGAMAGASTRGCESLDALVRHDPRFGLLVDALELVANHRDASVVIAFLDQKYAGDPSPSHTVAKLFGLSPANVRKIHSRVRTRLAFLVQDDARFHRLGGGDWLAGAGGPRSSVRDHDDDGEVARPGPGAARGDADEMAA